MSICFFPLHRSPAQARAPEGPTCPARNLFSFTGWLWESSAARGDERPLVRVDREKRKGPEGAGPKEPNQRKEKP